MLSKQFSVVDYSDKNSPQKMAEAIKTSGIFILTNLPEDFQKTIDTLYEFGDEVFDRLDSNRIDSKQFKYEWNDLNLNAVSHAEEGTGGCFWGNRIVATMNTANHQESISNIPSINNIEQSIVNNAFLEHHTFTQKIFQQTLAQLEIILDLKKGSLQEGSIGRAATGLTRYLPATQKRIINAFKAKQLCMFDKEKKEIMAFTPHADFSTMAALCYRDNNASGLYVKTADMPWSYLQIPRQLSLSLIIFGGRQLELLTNGHVTPLLHTVKITTGQQQTVAKLPPKKMRFMLASYVLNTLREYQPALKSNGERIQIPVDKKSPYECLSKQKNSTQILVNISEFVEQHFKEMDQTAASMRVESKQQLLRILSSYPITSEYDKVIDNLQT